MELMVLLFVLLVLGALAMDACEAGSGRKLAVIVIVKVPELVLLYFLAQQFSLGIFLGGIAIVTTLVCLTLLLLNADV